ncbi:hypothetical protein E2C01_065056 [Portunus trituberculatus]|uniref:Uncharacterized protein n=1 Tax=Portunus trituberculatus TaxID=210409 RepID=A0A5B7HNK7_PORTR|nr:hypothetical protein [Portunus trituberculatus]
MWRDLRMLPPRHTTPPPVCFSAAHGQSRCLHRHHTQHQRPQTHFKFVLSLL